MSSGNKSLLSNSRPRLRNTGRVRDGDKRAKGEEEGGVEGGEENGREGLKKQLMIIFIELLKQ